MPISYALFENNLTTNPSDFAAPVQIVDSLNLEEIADRMIAQGSAATDAKGCFASCDYGYTIS